MEALNTRDYVNFMMKNLSEDLTLLDGLTPSCLGFSEGVLSDQNAPAIVLIAGTRINLMGLIKLEIFSKKSVSPAIYTLLKKIGLEDEELKNLERAKLVKIEAIFQKFKEEINLSRADIGDLYLKSFIEEMGNDLREPFTNLLNSLILGQTTKGEVFTKIKKIMMKYFFKALHNLNELIKKINLYPKLSLEGNKGALEKLIADIETKREGCRVCKRENMLEELPILLERLGLCRDLISSLKDRLKPASSSEEIIGAKK